MKCQIAHGNDVFTECERTERQIMAVDTMFEEEYSQANRRYDRYIEQDLFVFQRFLLVDQNQMR